MSAESSFREWWEAYAASEREGHVWVGREAVVVTYAGGLIRKLAEADAAWASGQSVFAVRFNISPDMDYELHRLLGEDGVGRILSRASSCVVDLGWDLHTWEFGDPSSGFHAVFVRPRAAA